MRGIPSDGEIACEGVREIEATDRRGRLHYERIVENHRDASLDIEEVEELTLMGMVGRYGVADGGTDALVMTAEELGGIEHLIGVVGPQLGADAMVDPFGESLDEAVGKELAHNGRIVVAVGFHLVGMSFETGTSSSRKETDMVGKGGWRDIVGKGESRSVIRDLMLPHEMEACDFGGSGLVGEDGDIVITDIVCWIETDDGVRLSEPLGDHDVEIAARIGNEAHGLGCLVAVGA